MNIRYDIIFRLLQSDFLFPATFRFAVKPSSDLVMIAIKKGVILEISLYSKYDLRVLQRSIN